MQFRIVIFFTVFILFNSFTSLAQVNTVNSSQILDYANVIESPYSVGGEKILGSYLLFDDWINNCKIQLKGKQFTLNNVNFNIPTNEFMSEIGKDSVFAIHGKHIDFIEIENKVFKYYLYEGQNKFFEVLLDNELMLSFLKGFNTRILPRSEMGMLNRPYDEIKKQEKYFITNGTEIVKVKLNKKEILKYIKKDKQSKILKYIKERRLSFKKEKDVKEIFKYYNSI